MLLCLQGLQKITAISLSIGYENKATEAFKEAKLIKTKTE